ncbi:AsmA family protein [Polynucleobacter sp. UB-Piko-W3]|uniref:AsmA family protein n=1 Tax=Polynucleobacter sp. UB-Piko-W3 TaxID=1819735 RepID=UPI001C0C6BC0|nr:AsmA family protein [Polynucleobacter sp. UB-Piko-W3]MBU3555072.1 AsmA family protein [Polynucleobacter sp. UB-Piko-W3]
MTKTLKITLITFAAILTLGGLGAWYAASSINPTQLTQLLSSAVKDATGRDLKIAGPVSLKIFPSIGVKAEQVTLSNASWASQSQMLALKQIELDVKLFPLFLGRVEISSINLVGLDAYLQTNQVGQSNWNLSSPVTASNSKSSSSTSSNPPQASSSDNILMTIEAIRVSDARISYQNGDNPIKLLEIPKLSLMAEGSKTAILLDLQYANYKLGLKGNMGSVRQTIVDWDQAPLKTSLDLTLTLNGKSLDITGKIDKEPKVSPQFDIKLESKSFDLAPLVAASIASSVGKSTGLVKPISTQSKYFFSDDALPFNLLPNANGSIALNMNELKLPNLTALKDMSGTIAFKGDKIDINNLKFELGKGQAQAQISLSQISSAAPAVSMKALAKGFTLEQVVVSSDSSAKVSGGDVQVALNLSGRGKSLHQIVGGANGSAQMTVGNARIDSRLLNAAGDLAITIMDTLNPMRKQSNQTVLECAVAYLPVINGMVNVKDSVGVVTDKLNIVLSGAVNLNSEAINLKIDPHQKSGLTTGVDLGSLVQLEGTLQNPKAGINKEGVVNSAVSIGLGFLTGGMSIAAENVRSMSTKRQPCKTALHSWADIYPGSN